MLQMRAVPPGRIDRQGRASVREGLVRAERRIREQRLSRPNFLLRRRTILRRE